MKKFTVMSRSAAKKFSYGNIPEKTVIISITDVGSEDNRFNRQSNLVDVCRVKFDDVEKGEPNCITKNDAQKIMDFMKRYEDIPNVVVHCEAGVSRSAGCCAALMYVYNGSDMDIFSNARFCPNMTVYRTVLNTFMGVEDNWVFPEEETTENEELNLALWRKENDID